MKQILFPILLAVSLTITAISTGIYISSECDSLISEANNRSESGEFQEHWESFSKIAAFLTPYDLIRTGDSNCRQFVALIESDADDDDVEAAREVMISSIKQIKRIHSLDWELIF